jgi:hypothetical protein
VNETFDLLQSFSFYRKTSIGLKNPNEPKSPVCRIAVAIVEELVTKTRTKIIAPIAEIVELSMQRPRPTHDSLAALFLTKPSSPTVLEEDSEPVATPRSLALQMLERRAPSLMPPKSPYSAVVNKQRSPLQIPVPFNQSGTPRSPHRTALSFSLPPSTVQRSCSESPRVTSSHRRREATRSTDLDCERGSRSADSSSKSNTGWLSPAVSKAVSPIVDLFMPAMNLYAGLQ